MPIALAVLMAIRSIPQAPPETTKSGFRRVMASRTISLALGFPQRRTEPTIASLIRVASSLCTLRTDRQTVSYRLQPVDRLVSSRSLPEVNRLCQNERSDIPLLVLDALPLG